MCRHSDSLARLVIVAVFFTALAAVGDAQTNPGVQGVTGGRSTLPDFSRISRAEVEKLVSDLLTTNPMALKRLAEDPEQIRQQIESLRELLAFASQAKSEGLADEPHNRQELENIRSEVIAVNYDKEINKEKGPMPPFGFITEEQVAKFWHQGGVLREADFKRFLDAKVALLNGNDSTMKDRDVTGEEVAARIYYAWIKIYEQEYEGKLAAGQIPTTLRDKTELQVKLQQAQFLARQYSQKIAEQVKVTDEEIAKYISEHPEFGTATKKAKAEHILARAKAGEDLAALANQFSEDPGNRGPGGDLYGGLYADVKVGQMIPPFESAALALQPGELAPNIVETDYGYHIIKLEKKGESKVSDGEPAVTYDVRHILISTEYRDTGGTPVPIKTYVRTKLEQEKEKQVIGEIVKKHNIFVPDDFTIPQVTDEQIEEFVRKQMPQPDNSSPAVEKKKTPAKPRNQRKRPIKRRGTK